MDTPSEPVALPPLAPPSAAAGENRPAPRKPVSFTIGSGGTRTQGSAPAPAVAGTTAAPPAPPPAESLAPFPVANGLSQLPLLPRRKRPTFSRHRHDANPALAIKVLQDIQLAVEAWHRDLRQTVQLIQELYMEGPIVDGWLETVEDQTTPAVALDAALLRHGDPQVLSGYVDRLCQTLEVSEAAPGAPGSDLARPGYRLCSLDSDGRVQYFPCPSEQLSTISLAIARHQKLRQLLDHKQFLEAKLKRTVELMASSRDTLGIAPTCSAEPELGAE